MITLRTNRHINPRSVFLSLLPFFLAALAPALMQAQESFQATHVALLGDSPGVPDSVTGSGLIIFRYDPQIGTAAFRITVAGSNSPITGVQLLRRTATGSESIYQEYPCPPGETTTEAFIDLSGFSIASAVDSGVVHLRILSEAYPDGFIEGQINAIPNFIATGFEETAAADESRGEGNAYLSFDEDTRSARYVVAWSKLTGPATQAHFHRAPAGEDGPPIHTITIPASDSIVIGTWSNISAEDMEALKRGDIYVNIHTSKYQTGEIRGQIAPAHFFTAAIRPENEVTIVASSSAGGTGYLVYIDLGEQGAFIASNVVIADLTDTIESAHIHRAAIGEEGPVMIPYRKLGSNHLRIDKEYGDTKPDPADIAALLTGNTYANVHTKTYPNGEARGQWIPAITNLAASSVPAVAAGAERTSLEARIDADGTIRFTTAGERVRGDRTIILYSALGGRVAMIDAAAGAELPGGALASGIYIAQLVDGGGILATCPVRIVR